MFISPLWKHGSALGSRLCSSSEALYASTQHLSLLVLQDSWEAAKKLHRLIHVIGGWIGPVKEDLTMHCFRISRYTHFIYNSIWVFISIPGSFGRKSRCRNAAIQKQGLSINGTQLYRQVEHLCLRLQNGHKAQSSHTEVAKFKVVFKYSSKQLYCHTGRIGSKRSVIVL